MDKDERDGEDLGSGWLEVKKKHKSHPKSTHGKTFPVSGVSSGFQRNLQQGKTKNCTLASGSYSQKFTNQFSSSNGQKAIDNTANKLSNADTRNHSRSQDHNSHIWNEEKVNQGVKEESVQFIGVDRGSCTKSLSCTTSAETKTVSKFYCGPNVLHSNKRSEDTCQQHNHQSSIEESGKLAVEEHPAVPAVCSAVGGEELVAKDGFRVQDSVGDGSVILCHDLDALPLTQTPKIKWGNLDDDQLERTKSLRPFNGSPNSQIRATRSIADKLQEPCSSSNFIDNDEKCLFSQDNSKVMETKQCSNSNYDRTEHSLTINSDKEPKNFSQNSTDAKMFQMTNEDGITKCSSVGLVPSKQSRPMANSDKNMHDQVSTIHSVDGDSNLSEQAILTKSSYAQDRDGVNNTHSTNIENLSSIELPHAASNSFCLEGLNTADSSVAVAEEDFCKDAKMAAKILMNAFEKGEAEEGKERFRRRLWCFLFENLNRAVDELYLLCELECDIDQMKEAVTVLEEALSDFRELKSRIEGFDQAENLSSISQTSSAARHVKLKLEHCRPHSLSWEVRRLTSSPRRAEILSSSLEAFRKIQQETTNKYTSNLEKMKVDTSTASEANQKETLLGRSAVRIEPVPSRNDPTMKLKGKQLGKIETVNVSSPHVKEQVDASKCCKQSSMGNRIAHKGMQLVSSQIAGKSITNSLCSKVSSACSTSRTAGVVQSPPKLASNENTTEKNDIYLVTNHRLSNVMDKGFHIKSSASTPSLDAWKEKRNWESIVRSPLQSSRNFHSPIISRKSAERVRVLHDKLMSPERRRKSPLDMRRDAEEKHARAMRIRRELENERAQRLQKVSEKLNRVSEWQAVRSSKLREGMYARQQRGETRHEAYLAQIARRASDESSKVSEVRFITSLSEENKKLSLRQKLHDSELRRAERLQIMKTKQKEDMAREEAVLERRKLIEAEKLQRLSEIQRKKEEAQARREEERKAASAAREAKAVEQVRKKEVRAKAQREEAELQAQRLAERLRESELRRKLYLEQIREKASMDIRDQGSPSCRHSSSRDGQGRSVSQAADGSSGNLVNGCTSLPAGGVTSLQQQSFKKKVKKIRQRLMTLKYDFVEPPAGAENLSLARSKIGRWLQEMQRLRQARKGCVLNIGMIIGDLIKFLDGKETELHAARQAGLLDFIASALPASHTSKPEACQTTVLLLRVLKVVLVLPDNCSYFLARNLLPPLVLMLSAALENYCTIAASTNSSGGVFGNCGSNPADKISDDKLETIGEVLEGLLWCVGAVMGHICAGERQMQIKDDLAELIVACKVIHNLRDLFSLFDRPQVEGATFPGPVLLALNLLKILTCPKGDIFAIDWDAQYAKSGTLSKAILSGAIGYPGNLVSLQVSSPQENESMTSSMKDIEEDITISRSISNDKYEAKTEMLTKEDAIQINDAIQEDIRDSQQSAPAVLTKTKWSQEATHASETYSMNEAGKMVEFVTSDTFNAAAKGTDGKRLITRRKNNQIGLLTDQSMCVISVIADTGLVGLLSMLTAILLQANPRTITEQVEYVLPSNFEEVATGVLKIMNNLARLDLTLIQDLLAQPDLQMEFFHLMSFLLTHCTNKWRNANDKVAFLLFETLLLLGYFALLHPGNQAVLRWGKSPTIIHKICDLPFAFFSDPQLTPILVGTLLAVCYGCEQNRNVVQQELSMDMLLVLLKSSKQDMGIPADAKQGMFCQIGAQLNGPSNFLCNQGGTMDVIAEESEEEMREILGQDTSSKTQGTPARVSIDSSVTDILSNPLPQTSFKTKSNPLSTDNVGSIKRQRYNKAVLQAEHLGKESSWLRTTGSKGSKGKAISANKENLTYQTRGSKTSSCDSSQKIPSMLKKGNLAATLDQKNNLSNEGKSAKDYEGNPLLSPVFMLQNRFPASLIDHAQSFFACGLE
eukprot:TRINITY_DN31081_c0_g1_i1.p1 TRINITY_DN31081_c0_g1~~TRINITY_DN31081_c0_g1_i1.p1  ORF type:complete len:1920 (+),score=403.73 TRINITY_DN31081_c0_g1_i1:313-6072(+)